MKNKKLIMSIILTGLVFGLCGCGGKKEKETATNPVEPYEEQIDDVNSQVSEELSEMENVMDNLEDY